MTDRITITLGFPHRDLWQNKKASHWAVSRATKKAREEAFYAAKAAGIEGIHPAGRYAVLFEGYRPIKSGKPHDVQNLAATLKGHIDGIADALGLDDDKLAVDYPGVWAGVVRNGKVVAHVIPIVGVVS